MATKLKNKNDIDYNRLANSLLQSIAGGTTTKAVSSTPTALYGHGPGGLFSTPGLNRRLFSAIPLPVQGLQSILPAFPTNETSPIYGLLTGVTATTGSEPEGVCDDAPVAGTAKLCTQSFPLGRFSRSTRVYDISRVGQVTNRGEFTDFDVIGNPFKQLGTGNNGVPSVFSGNPMANIAKDELGKAIAELAISWARDFGVKLYTGTPTNNTAGGGHKEAWGLDYLINSGHRDAETGVACPAADSQVDSFGGLNIRTNGALLVRQIADMHMQLSYQARTEGLNPATWVLVMSYSAFWEITEVWPCSYLTYQCSFSNAQDSRNADADDLIRMRDDMRGDMDSYTGQYLLINGQKVRVVIDDSIPETSIAGGSFQSKIYFVPMMVLGRIPVTFLEYFNFDAPGAAMSFVSQFFGGNQFMTSDGGRFLIHLKPATNWCVQLQALTSTRLLLLTPQLAGVIHSIQYTPYKHVRTSQPGSTYFYNGGKTDRIGLGPSFYSPVA